MVPQLVLRWSSIVTSYKTELEGYEHDWEVTLRETFADRGKEKLLAALRGGIKTVIIPDENVKDLAEIPDNVKNDLEIIPVTTVSEVLEVALSKKLQSIEWDFAEYENSDNLKGKQSGEVELPN